MQTVMLNNGVAMPLLGFYPQPVSDSSALQRRVRVNQIETHPFHQQVETQQFLQDNGVQIESWGSFAEGENNDHRDPAMVKALGAYRPNT